MRAVWKYRLSISEKTILSCPLGAAFLHAYAPPRENPLDIVHVFVWAEIPDTTAVLEDRTILIRGSGHAFQGNEGHYIGTAHTPPFVWHVYEEKA